jgi:hypothetical protein
MMEACIERERERDRERSWGKLEKILRALV